MLPVRTALSGPAAGVIAAGYIGIVAGYPNISCDMGGTCFRCIGLSMVRVLLTQSSIGWYGC